VGQGNSKSAFKGVFANISQQITLFTPFAGFYLAQSLDKLGGLSAFLL